MDGLLSKKAKSGPCRGLAPVALVPSSAAGATVAAMYVCKLVTHHPEPKTPLGRGCQPASSPLLLELTNTGTRPPPLTGTQATVGVPE